jgi:hypothetical protein
VIERKERHARKECIGFAERQNEGAVRAVSKEKTRRVQYGSSRFTERAYSAFPAFHKRDPDAHTGSLVAGGP